MDRSIPGPGTPHLAVSAVTKKYGSVTANDAVSLAVSRGEIHGILGENGAGKSTLVEIIAGFVTPDEGTIHVNGRSVPPGTPSEARKAGVGIVHQHFMLVPAMTVAENVALSMRFSRKPFRTPADAREKISEASARLGVPIDPTARVEDLSLGARQWVEILRLLLHGADLLIFDEPTAVLTPREWEDLERVMRRLTADGKTVLLITHKLDELLSATDRCTVMRAGRVVRTLDTSDADKPSLARMMVGRDVVLRAERVETEQGAPILRVRHLSSHGSRPLRDLSFDVHSGEVFGVAGVDGNGQDELVLALVGMLPTASGEIELGKRRLHGRGPAEFAARGGAAIYADRQRDGLALVLSIEDNLLMAQAGSRTFTKDFTRLGWLRRDVIRGHCRELIKSYDIRTPDLHGPIGHLSGGNQQKAILARELGRRPQVLIAAQPTRGLDVATIAAVYEEFNHHKRLGGATLLISTELDELLTLCDRIAVILDGAFTAVLERGEATLDALGSLLGGETTMLSGSPQQ